MAEAKHAASYSPPEHHAGTWYSVPDLRLRDHRFIVPLDYSIDRSASPKISIFVREVVAGTITTNTTTSSIQLQDLLAGLLTCLILF